MTSLDRSLAFYRDILGFTPRFRGPRILYLQAGNLWLCLSLKEEDHTASAGSDYSHIAFSVAPADFTEMAKCLAGSAPTWQDNSSEGASHYFTDPDGHKLEIHVGDLESRLAAYRADPLPGSIFFD